MLVLVSKQKVRGVECKPAASRHSLARLPAGISPSQLTPPRLTSPHLASPRLTVESGTERLMTPPAPAREVHRPDPEPDPDPDIYIHAGGRCGSWASLARVLGAEALGTALLVLLAASPPPAAPHLASLQAGLAVAALVQCFGDISGAQLNPCVSLAALMSGRMEPRRALLEAAAQLVGAALGAAALRDPRSALTLPAALCPLPAALCAEALCCACLVLANCAQWETASRGADSTWPLRVGAVVAALSGAAGGVSGGSMNPARSFGPALVAAHWERHWVYWVGPLSGAVAAAALHRAAWRAPRTSRPATANAPAPLCKP